MPANIDIIINGKDMTGAAVSSAKGGLASLGSSVEATSSKFNAMTVAAGTIVGNLATAGIAKMGEFVGSIVTTGINFNNMKQQADIAFTTMLGSGEKAKAFLDKLQAFAAKTPFEFPDLLMASQRMLAMGFQSDKVLPTLTAIGDAVAGLGGSSAMVDRVTTALGQMQAKGKATGEEMIQLTEAGIPAWDFLAKKIGVSIPEAMKMVTAGAVSADVAIGALTEGMNTKFGGMMEKQSATFGGLASTIKDTFAQTSAQVVEPLFDKLSKGFKMVVDLTSKPQFSAGVKTLAEWIQKMVDKLWDWGERVLPPLIAKVNDIIGYIGKFMEAIKLIMRPVTDAIAKYVSMKDVLTALGVLMAGPLLAAIGGVIASLASFLAPIAAVVAAVAALRWAWENDFIGIRTFTLSSLKKLSDWFFNESGIWKGTFAKTLEYLKWWADGGWKNDVFFPIRSTLTKIGSEIQVFKLYTSERFAEWVQRVKDYFSGLYTDSVETFNQLKDKVIEIWHKWTDPTIKEITDWASRTYAHLSQWVDDMKARFDNWKDDMIERFQPVFDWWEEHVGPWIDYGRDVVQGLWDGMKDVWRNLSEWFTGVWGDLTDRFKRFFGIASPSKLFASYGQYLMEGLGNGIEAYASVPKTMLESTVNSMTAQLDRLKGAVVANVFDINNAVKQLNLNPLTMPASMGGTGKVVGLGPNGELIMEGINKLPTQTNPQLSTPPASTNSATNNIGSAVGGNIGTVGTSQGLLGGINLSTGDIGGLKQSAADAAKKVKDFIAGLSDYISETVDSRNVSRAFWGLDSNLTGQPELQAAEERIRQEMADLLGVNTLYGRLSDSLGAVIDKVTSGTNINKVADLLQSAVNFRGLANYYSTSDYADVLPTDTRLTGGKQTTNTFNITLAGSSNATADVMGMVQLLSSLTGTASP